MKSIATWIRECDEAYFTRAFAPYPEVQLYNARTEAVNWEQMHGLLLTGGSDISANFLRQPVPNPALIEDADPARDAWEFAKVALALQQKLPILAICRGLQVLNVALGGTLHLDIPNHDSHKTENQQILRYVAGTALQIPQVNSSHHQALDRLGMNLEVEAWCDADDVIEQARLAHYPFALGLQYHPERDPIYRPLFDAFIAQIT